jgi:hypothetical protein
MELGIVKGERRKEKGERRKEKGIWTWFKDFCEHLLYKIIIFN